MLGFALVHVANGTPANPLISHAELVIKLGTGVIGATYVLGVLVSNVQLMALGVSDFGALQTRNILTGAGFFHYLLWMVAIVMPVSVALVSCFATVSSRGTWRSKLKTCFVRLVVGVLCGVLFAFLASSVVGYMSPWGLPWNPTDGLTVSWAQYKRIYGRIYGQFLDFFWHPRTIVAGILLIMGLIPVASLARSRWRRLFMEHDDHDALLAANPVMRVARFFPIVYAFMAILPLIFDYAQEVYPNISYNLGGGQPQVAELLIEGVAPVSLTTSPLSADGHAVRSEAVAIWYQSDKFMYLSPVSAAGAGITVMALEIGAVKSIRYLQTHVRVAAGGRIVSVQPN